MKDVDEKREVGTHTQRHTDRHTHTHTQTDRQTDTHTHTHTHSMVDSSVPSARARREASSVTSAATHKFVFFRSCVRGGERLFKCGVNTVAMFLNHHHDEGCKQVTLH